jgi:hypothetical protein
LLREAINGGPRLEIDKRLQPKKCPTFADSPLNDAMY